jgi:hypothetical protein
MGHDPDGLGGKTALFFVDIRQQGIRPWRPDGFLL